MSHVVAAAPGEGRRLRELDSLRGVAAMTVVLSHFRDMWVPTDIRTVTLWKRVALILLNPLVAGPEAVILFFVLSGLVLSLPYLRGRNQPYRRFLARRVLRIYGPYLAALGLSVAGAAIWHGHPYHGFWASRTWTQPIEPRLVAQHVGFIGVYDWGEYNFVFWSLIQEMRISAIFPLLFGVVMALGEIWSMLLAACLSVVAYLIVSGDPHTSPWYSLPITVHYVAFFIVGILIASQLGQIAAWWRDVKPRTRKLFAGTSLLIYSYNAFACNHFFRLFEGRPFASDAQQTILQSWVVLLGAAGLIVVAVEAVPARRFLMTAPASFLGGSPIAFTWSIRWCCSDSHLGLGRRWEDGCSCRSIWRYHWVRAGCSAWEWKNLSCG